MALAGPGAWLDDSQVDPKKRQPGMSRQPLRELAVAGRVERRRIIAAELPSCRAAGARWTQVAAADERFLSRVQRLVSGVSNADASNARSVAPHPVTGSTQPRSITTLRRIPGFAVVSDGEY